jgi:hypothetical protein
VFYDRLGEASSRLGSHSLRPAYTHSDHFGDGIDIARYSRLVCKLLGVAAPIEGVKSCAAVIQSNEKVFALPKRLRR